MNEFSWLLLTLKTFFLFFMMLVGFNWMLGSFCFFEKKVLILKEFLV